MVLPLGALPKSSTSATRASPQSSFERHSLSLGTSAQATRCTANTLRAFVVRFTRSFNAGDRNSLRRLVQAADFHWYTVDDPVVRLGAGLYERGAVLAYFARRHVERERLRLRRFAFNGNNAEYGHFDFRLLRSARDLSSTVYEGKGAARCDGASATLAAWSMGRPDA